MQSIQELANIVHSRIEPKSSDESAITLEEVIASCRYYYSTLVWQAAKQEKNSEGFYDVPSYLLLEIEKEVVNNTIDITGIKALKSLPNEGWLLSVGDPTECEYIKSTFNRSRLLDDDETFEGMRTFYIFGDKIKFPRGVHKSTMPIMIASNGSDLDPMILIDESISGLLMDKLSDAYSIQRIAKEDETNNSSSNS